VSLRGLGSSTRWIGLALVRNLKRLLQAYPHLQLATGQRLQFKMHVFLFQPCYSGPLLLSPAFPSPRIQKKDGRGCCLLEHIIAIIYYRITLQFPMRICRHVLYTRFLLKCFSVRTVLQSERLVKEKVVARLRGKRKK